MCWHFVLDVCVVVIVSSHQQPNEESMTQIYCNEIGQELTRPFSGTNEITQQEDEQTQTCPLCFAETLKTGFPNLHSSVQQTCNLTFQVFTDTDPASYTSLYTYFVCHKVYINTYTHTQTHTTDSVRNEKATSGFLICLQEAYMGWCLHLTLIYTEVMFEDCVIFTCFCPILMIINSNAMWTFM